MLADHTSLSGEPSRRAAKSSDSGTLAPVFDRPNHAFVRGSIGDRELVLRLLAEQRPGATINLAAETHVGGLLDESAPNTGFAPHGSPIDFAEDRPGHDRRYAIDAGKIRRELGWSPRDAFESGMEKTVRWYLENQAWCESALSCTYHGERLRLKRP